MFKVFPEKADNLRDSSYSMPKSLFALYESLSCLCPLMTS